MDLYSLSRQWFDWSFENPELIKPSHTALYFFCIEHCNRLGWKDKFGLPTTMAKDAIGIKSYHTYIDTLNDLINWGFIKLIQKSTNQYSCNIIALSNNAKAHSKALDKALIKHMSKQSQSTVQSIDSIDIQDTSIQNTIYREFKHLKLSFTDFDKLINLGYSKIQVDDILDRIENFKKNTKYINLFLTAKTWLKKDYNIEIEQPRKQGPQNDLSKFKVKP